MTTKLPELQSGNVHGGSGSKSTKESKDDFKHNWSKYGSIDRSEWMNSQIKPYPPPGLYSLPTFIEDLDKNPIKSRYGFLNDGRKKSVSKRRKGEYLLPGAYSFEEFGDIADKKPSYYSFKASRRRTKDMFKGLTDTEITVGPGQYDNHTYLSIQSVEGSEKMMMFRSKSKRFPSNEFKPKEGPSPTEYQSVLQPSISPVTSAFKSRTTRFSSSYTKYPGPGTYDKVYHSPPPPHVRNLGRQHGLFFSSTFCQ